MFFCKKAGNKGKITPLDVQDIPRNFMHTASSIREEQNGAYKLRARNDKIHAELNELARELNTKLIVQKSGDRIFYIVQGYNLSVSLVNQ